MTLILIFLTSLISVIALNNRKWFDLLKFNAALIRDAREGWRFFSYGLIHADYIHLIVNMFVLYSFGPLVEAFYEIHFHPKAEFYFILLYAGGIVLSVVSSYARHKGDVFYNAVGASGAVSGVVFALILFHPGLPLRFIFVPVEIPAVIFGGVYLGYSWYMSRRGDGLIGHDAHFWGGVFGFVYTLALKPSLMIDFAGHILRILPFGKG